MYGQTMVFDAFFNSLDLPKEKTGGWLVRGHNSKAEYDEYVVVGKWSSKYIPTGWIDWIRVPIETGSELLNR